MEGLEQIQQFEANRVIEQTPFKEPVVQAFFSRWCRINDSITPQFLSREEWDRKGLGKALEAGLAGEHTLYLPQDLHLWEMACIIELVDSDTYNNRPDLRSQKREEIDQLGQMFKNTGIYIAKRIGVIDEGKPIAESLAQQLYSYGISLSEGKAPEDEISIDTVSQENLTDQETEEVDKWIAGAPVYNSRLKRVEQELTQHTGSQKKDIIEQERNKTLCQFFKVADRAFQKSKRVTGASPPLYSAFLKSVDRKMKLSLETPKRKLEDAIYRRGIQNMLQELKSPNWRDAIRNFFILVGYVIDLPTASRAGGSSLLEVLGAESLRQELQDARQSKDSQAIGQKEREIALKIQKLVKKYPRKLHASLPAEIAKNRYINCVGATILGSSVLSDLKINHLVASTAGHSLIFVVSSDRRVHYIDMMGLHPGYKEIKDGDLKSKDGQLTVSDIVEFSQHSTRSGITFQIPSFWYRIASYNINPIAAIAKGQNVSLFQPEIGNQMQILNNVGLMLEKQGSFQEAVEAFRQAVNLVPDYIDGYEQLGRTLEESGQKREAIAAYQEFVRRANRSRDGSFNKWSISDTRSKIEELQQHG